MPHTDTEILAILKGERVSNEDIARFRAGSAASTTRKNKSRTELKDLMEYEMDTTGWIDVVALKEHPLYTDHRLTHRYIEQICEKRKWEYESIKEGKALIAYRRKMDLKEVAEQVIDRFPSPGPQEVLEPIDISDVCAKHGTNAKEIVAQSGKYLAHKGGNMVVRVQ